MGSPIAMICARVESVKKLLNYRHNRVLMPFDSLMRWTFFETDISKAIETRMTGDLKFLMNKKCNAEYL